MVSSKYLNTIFTSATLSFAESKRPINGIHMYIYVYIHGKHTQLQLYWCHLLDA